jgi:predicted acetyltransferase
MRRQLADVRQRGDPIAILYASQSPIYGRYGYGVSIQHANYRIETRHAAFAAEQEIPGRVRLLDKEAAANVLPEVFERFRLLQPGALNRPPRYWDEYLRDPEDRRRGASARFYAVCEREPGQIDGFAPYRIKEHWEREFPASTLTLLQIIALTPQSRVALWKYCLNVDLVTSVETRDAPSEEPIRWMLADFRRLQMTDLVDGVWLRPVDIPATLAGRRYATTDRLVLGITDAFCADNDGCYELEGSPDGAESRRTQSDPDLELDVTDLGAVYFGNVRFSTLSRAFRVVECTPGALQRADLMFESDVTPWCTQGF